MLSSSGSQTPVWGGETIWLVPARRPAKALARLVRLDFLGLWPIRLENPDYERWICLDFLGFSRAKRDLSLGYERKTE